MSARLAFLLLMLSCVWPSQAQEADTSDATPDFAEALQTGRYEVARRLLQERLEAGETEHAPDYAETFRAEGAYDEGLEALEGFLEDAPDDPYLLYAKGMLLVDRGRYEEAEAAFREVTQQQPDLWANLLAWGKLMQQTGRSAEARRLYAAIYRRYQEGAFRTSEALSVAGQAAAELAEFRDANDAFRTAYRLDGTDVQNLRRWADLFRKQYNDADAERTYEEALGVNPRQAGLLVGLARSGQGFGRQEELARQALEVNPNSMEALDLLAELRILDGLYDEARETAQQALGVNPSSVSSLAHLASAYYLEGDTARYAQTERQALAINPQAGNFYLTVADNVVRRFRYPDAVRFTSLAVGVDRSNPDVYAALGLALFRLGAQEQARRYLEAAFNADPYNLFVGNTLTLLDEYENFSVLESEHFRLLIHASEGEVMGPDILETAEAAYDALSARYPYRPQGKIRIEAYNDAGDFAVRVAGVPHLGLLGVAFGDIVALTTPEAQAGRPHNWARTLWHELAHTMAIGVSDFHVPRWFTEGLSVYEEQLAYPAWGREMDLELFAAFDQGKLLPLEEIDRGFTRPTFPGQILLSYYHASKVIAFVADEYGFEAVIATQQHLAQGDDIGASVQKATGQSLAALDEAFRESLTQQRQRLAGVLQDLQDLSGEAEGEDAEEPDVRPEAAGRTSNPFFRLLDSGGAALEAERYDEAERDFNEALNLYSDFVGSGNPYEGLAAIYRARGDTAALAGVLERFLQRAELAASAARELAALNEADEAWADVALNLRRSLNVEPYDLDVRRRLAEAYEKLGRTSEAVTQRRAIVALDPVDEAAAYYQLAMSLYANEDLPEAKRAVLQSLERAPGYRDAQRLLLRMVEE